MAKNQTITKQEELILLNDHKNEANALINKLETEILPHIGYLSSLFDTLEMGKMTENDFRDLIENSGKEVSKRYQSSLEEKFKSIPSTHLITLASNAALTHLSSLLSESENTKNKYSEYFKYLTFNEENEIVLLNSTKVKIYEDHKEYELKPASELRKKHKQALDAVNEFFLMLKQLSPDYIILNASLVAAFDESPNELQTTQPFQLREINYQVIAENAESFERNRVNRKMSDFVFDLEKQYRSDGTGKVYSIIDKMMKGTPEEAFIASSDEVKDFIVQMKEIEANKRLPKIPKVINANPNL